MAKSDVPLVATGDWIDAAWLNQYLRDNIAAVWVGTTAGDTDYYTSNVTKARIAIGAVGTIYESDGAKPVWVQNKRYFTALLNKDIALVAGDDAFRFRIPSALNGWKISGVAASRKAGTGVVTLQIRNVTDAVDVLSTALTIDSGETDSSTAATPAVINTSNDDVATGHQFAVDVDGAGTGTFYTYIEIEFTKQ